MFINIDKIQSAKHILLVVHNDSFINASALYTYILTLHKKVSIQNIEPLKTRFSFLPWFDKCRENRPSSADYVVEVSSDTLKLYNYFVKNNIRINQKMATALYAGLLISSDFFMSESCNGTIFAAVSELLELRAQKKICHEFLLNKVPLSQVRLKEKLLKSLFLQDNAKHVIISLSEKDLKSSGSELEDAYEIMKDFLKIVHVERVTLLNSDENNKIIKEI